MTTPSPTPQDAKRVTKKQRNRAAGRPVQTMSFRAWWQSPIVLGGGAAVIIVIAIVVFAVVGSNGSSTNSAGLGAVSSAVVAAVTHPGDSVIASVGTGGQPGELNRVTGTPILKSADGRPQVVYVGAEYCPYCGAERWSIVMAMARFGTFSNLQEMTSSSTDVDPNTNTFTFHGSTYSSSVVDFQPTELEDRNEQPFESPSAQVSQIFTTIDQPPYSASKGGFPFLDIAGRFTLNATSYDPAVLQGLSWAQIATDLSDPSSPVAQAIVGNANYLTAATCTVTGNKPASACSAPVIQKIETTLNAQPPVA